MSHRENQSLVRILAECAAVCSHCAYSCLQEENASEMARCIRLDIDCADICLLALKMVSRQSEHAEHVLRECNDICNACAEECSTHSHMEHCRVCAEICKACAEACLQGVI